MDWLRQLRFRLRALLRRKDIETEMAEEMRAHLQFEADARRTEGAGDEQARAMAQRAFGGVEQAKERCRDELQFTWLEQAWQDVRYAIRALMRSRSFTVTAVLTLALGIGVTAAMFTVVDSVLLRPIAYPASEHLVVVAEAHPPDLPSSDVSPGNYLDWAEQSADVFESIYALHRESFTLTGTGAPMHVSAIRATGRYFETLRSSALLGRVFGPSDEQAGRNRIAVLSHGFWQAHFGGRPEVVGETIRLNGWIVTVIGVMPPDFQRGGRTSIFTPLFFGADARSVRGDRYLSVGARLKPGVTLEQAQMFVTRVAGRMANDHPATNRNWGATVTPVLEYETGGLRRTLVILLGGAALLLIIACSNVAHLLLARATVRQREFSLRSALGANPGRLFRQALVESLVLAGGGGLLGFFFARWGLDGLLQLAPPDLPRAAEVTLNGRIVAASLTVTVLTGVAFGIAPALQAWRSELGMIGCRGPLVIRGSKWAHRLRDGLVVGQIAIAVVLLAVAGLLVRSFARLAAVDLGFEPQGALRVNLQLSFRHHGRPEQQLAFADAALGRLRALSGVRGAAAADIMALSGEDQVREFSIEGSDSPDGEPSRSTHIAVTPDYFETLGVPLKRGRVFSPHDNMTGAPVAVVSEGFARKYLTGVDPLGRRIRSSDGKWLEIVGVVADVRHHGIAREPAPQSYVPFHQTPSLFLSFVIRVEGSAAAFGSALRREIQAVHPEQAVTRIESMTGLVSASIARQRFAMTLCVAYSSVALLLAAIGVHGVLSYTVAQRVRELGVRLALGASPSDVVRFVLARGVRLIAVGVVLGLGAALAVTRALETLLYNTSARDPVVLCLIALGLAGAGIIACLGPAFRAARIDPMIALRAE
jgi:predicted permease